MTRRLKVWRMEFLGGDGDFLGSGVVFGGIGLA
jgi:hypothetical protein